VQKEKEKKEEEERKAVQTSSITISAEEYHQLKQQNAMVLKMAERLAEVEKVLKRGHPEGENPPAKKPKVGKSNLSVRLAAKPHLLDPRYFYNWWSKRSKKDIPKNRVVGELSNMGFAKTTLETLGPNVLSEVYSLICSQLLNQGAIDRLPKFVPKVYANKGLTKSMVLEKLEILSPSIQKFILSERRLEVDSRRAGKVAIEIRATSSKPTIAQNDARHRINEKHAKAKRNPVQFPGQVISIKKAPIMYNRQGAFTQVREGTSKSTNEISALFPPEITRAAKGPPSKAAFSNISNMGTDKATKAIPHAEVNIEVSKEVVTKDILALSSDESDSSQEEITEVRTVREVSEVMLERENPFKKVAACTSTDENPLSGSSSHDQNEPHQRGRTRHREPRGHHDSMTPTPERDTSCASRHTFSSSSSKKRSFKETLARTRSLLAERTIPGHASRATRETTEPSSTLKGRPASSRDTAARQHHQWDQDHH